MEVRFFVALKDNARNERKITNEIHAIRRMLPGMWSFRTFCKNNDVFDMDKQKRIKNETRLFHIYAHGPEKASVYIINRN